MQLLDHVSLSVPDLARARPFYHAIFNALGAVVVYDHADAIGYGERCERSQPGHSYLTVRASAAPLSADPGRHWCFKAASHAQVRAFHAAALAHGGEDDGPPGLRAHYHADYYAAFVRDPFGNRLEAVCHGETVLPLTTPATLSATGEGDVEKPGRADSGRCALWPGPAR